MTSGASVPQFPRAVTSRTPQAELHRARHLVHVPTAVALGADRRGASGRSGPIARPAYILPIHLQRNLSAANRLPEIDVHSVLEIGPLLRLRTRLPRLPSPKHFLEDVGEPETRAARFAI